MKLHFLGTGAADWDPKKAEKLKEKRQKEAEKAAKKKKKEKS